MTKIWKSSGLTLFIMIMVVVNQSTAQTHQLVPRFGDSAIQGFDSRMAEGTIQRFDSGMRNPMVQRFESKMLRSPVQDFNSQMLNSAIQRFNSRMMNSPAQRVEGPWKSPRWFSSSFYSIRRQVIREREAAEVSRTISSRPLAATQFISFSCGASTKITVGESEMLSEKEDEFCDHLEDNLSEEPD